MSRIGKKPIEIPAGVQVSIKDRVVAIESGANKLTMTHRPEVGVTWSQDERRITVTLDEKLAGDRKCRAYWGLTRSLIQNMVVGVTKGYEKKLEVVGAGWGATVKGQELELKVGYADPVLLAIPQGLDVSVERSIVAIKGADKQAVGQFAAMARSTRKPEPYQGKGVKYVDEVIKRKQGKVFGA